MGGYISAWLPKYISPNRIQFMRGRTGSTEVLFGTNGLDWRRCLDRFEQLEIQADRARAILIDNPRRVHGL